MGSSRLKHHKSKGREAESGNGGYGALLSQFFVKLSLWRVFRRPFCLDTTPLAHFLSYRGEWSPPRLSSPETNERKGRVGLGPAKVFFRLN